MKKLIVSAAALSLLAGAAYAQGNMKNDAQKKNEPNMMAPADKNSQRPGTSARPAEGGTSGNSSGRSGQSGGAATGGAGAGSASSGAGGAEGTGGGSAK